MNCSSLILLSVHNFAYVAGVRSDLTSIIPSLTRNSIALTNSFSDIASLAHHPAVFFTQSGVF